jgi:glycosyltransferase involved in cell wall biosynthesis
MLRVLTCFRDAAPYLPRCLASLTAQTETEWRCHLVDDTSTDGSYDLALRLTAGDPRFTVLRNTERRYMVGSTHRVLTAPEVDDDDVMVALDGDDWLPDPAVLTRVRAAYADPATWITYGQFVFWDGAERPLRPGFAAPPADPACVRTLPWSTTHLKTWKVFLWRQIRPPDLLGPRGAFWETSCDQALVLPMIEMAGRPHARFLPEVNYVYNQESPANEFKLDGERQRANREAIRRRPPYAPLADRPCRS